MRFLHILVVASAALCSYALADPEAEWQRHKRSLSTTIPPELQEKYKREFMREKLYIKKHNLLYKNGKVSWESGENEYTSMPDEIFNKKLKGFRRHKKRKNMKGLPSIYLPKAMVNDKKLPESFSWVERGAVSRVKNQGLCGSCYTYSAAGALEGLMKIRYNQTVIDLSNQELLDCTGTFGNDGCDGGEMTYAFKYVISKPEHAITSATNYPYRHSVTRCSDYGQVYAPIKDYVEIPAGDEQALKAAVVNYGPVATALDSRNLKPYKKGIYEDPNCSYDNIDHAVLIVGYGTEDGKKYWLVKNSWGETFGENGYFKILREAKSHCGIAHEAVFPIAANHKL